MTPSKRSYEWRVSTSLKLDVALVVPLEWKGTTPIGMIGLFRPAIFADTAAVAPQLAVQCQPIKASSTELDELTDLYVLSFKNQVNDFKIVSNKKAKIANVPSRMVTITYKEKDLQLSCEKMFMVVGKNLFIITYWSLAADFKKYLKDAEAMMASFVVTDREIPDLPSEDKNIATIESTMKAVLNALSKNDRKKIYAMLSQGFQKEWSFDSFERRFDVLEGLTLELSKIKASSMKFMQPPIINGYNQLVSSFYYNIGKGKIEFAVVYVLVGKQWKLANIFATTYGIEKKIVAKQRIGFK